MILRLCAFFMVKTAAVIQTVISQSERAATVL